MASNIGRRKFLATLGGAAAAWPLAAGAGWKALPDWLSRSDLARRVQTASGCLAIGPSPGRIRRGQEYCNPLSVARGRSPPPGACSRSGELDIDVLVVLSTPGARATKQATSTVPIVMAAVGDPVAAGLVASLARPGGNLTGLTFFFAEICAKRVELIREMIPALTRLAVIVNPAHPSHPIALDAMQGTARALGIELVPAEVKGRDDFAAAIAAIATRQIPALVAIEDPLVDSNAQQIAHFALQQRLPMIGFSPQAEAGALMEYDEPIGS